MAVKHEAVTVGTSATNLLGTIGDKGRTYDENVTSRSLVLSNTSSVMVYLGGSDVTSSSYGIALAAGERLSLDLTYHDVPFAAVAAGTAVVRVLHLGV